MTPREQGDQIRLAPPFLETLESEGGCWLKLEDALDITETILYPEGLQTEEEYNRLIIVTKAGCRAINYNDEKITLLPPVVSFRQRGTYLKKRCSELVEEMPAKLKRAIQAIIADVAANDYELISINSHHAKDGDWGYCSQILAKDTS